MAEITLSEVTKRYADGTEAVSSVDLEIADGELMVLVGPSGCGKSTLLRMIAGLEDVSEGRISIGGRDVTGDAPRERNMAMVFQSYALYPHMTVRDNLAFPLKLAKVARDEVRRRVEEAATMLDLSEHLDRKPANLSGGQRQRVAMGRALVREPEAFLLDEPLSNLDAKLRVQMRTEVARLQERLGTTTVYVTHDQTEAMTLGDRVAVLRKGVLQQVAPPQELYARPGNLFVAGFIGSPAMNLLPAHVEGGRLRTPVGDLPAPPDLSSKDLLVGIRPEHLGDAGGDMPDGAPTFDVHVDVVESLGSDVYAYVTPEADTKATAHGNELQAVREELGADAGAGRLVARLPADSGVKRGGTTRLWFDPAEVHLFDAGTGKRLSGPADGRAGVVEGAASGAGGR